MHFTLKFIAVFNRIAISIGIDCVCKHMQDSGPSVPNCSHPAANPSPSIFYNFYMYVTSSMTSACVCDPIPLSSPRLLPGELSRNESLSQEDLSQHAEIEHSSSSATWQEMLRGRVVIPGQAYIWKTTCTIVLRSPSRINTSCVSKLAPFVEV